MSEQDAKQGHIYTCAECGGTFEAEWTEEEAVAELRRDFGSVSLDQCDQVCDECYQKISPQNNPEYYKRYLDTPPPTQTILDDTEVIRAYVDAEISRKLNEWIDQEIANELLGVKN